MIQECDENAYKFLLLRSALVLYALKKIVICSHAGDTRYRCLRVSRSQMASSGTSQYHCWSSGSFLIGAYGKEFDGPERLNISYS